MVTVPLYGVGKSTQFARVQCLGFCNAKLFGAFEKNQMKTEQKKMCQNLKKSCVAANVLLTEFFACLLSFYINLYFAYPAKLHMMHKFCDLN